MCANMEFGAPFGAPRQCAMVRQNNTAHQKPNKNNDFMCAENLVRQNNTAHIN
ncbi:MAG: hypothetical protein HQL52_19490 [Magnetococcales bacterium]|nr:hypothetical protein [Magnetococcales bacterium]